MTSKEKIAYLNAQTMAATIELEAMLAENDHRQMMRLAPAYMEHHFLNLIEKYGLHSNAILKLFEPD